MNENKLKEMINGKNILITGGTGTIGKAIVKNLLEEYNPQKIIIFSRDEYKQSEMEKIYPISKYNNLRYFIGDIRDKTRLDYAFYNVDIIFHTAALKQVPALEFNPQEAIKTNINGTDNIIEIAIKNKVKYVIGMSTDKTAYPSSLYGATKLCMEKLMVSANNYGRNHTIFSVIRSGNIFGSRGSVVPLFLEQKNNEILTITDKNMTRFTMTITETTDFIFNCLSQMIGGEIFVPKIQSYKLSQLIDIIGKNCKIQEIGFRSGEKMHETMVCEYESASTIDTNDKYVITQQIINNNLDKYKNIYGDKLCPPNWNYSSDKNDFINNESLTMLIDKL